MKTIKILFIAPYPGLVEPICQVLKQHPNIEAVIKIGDLHHGVTITRSLLSQNFDLIISRGGTADLLRTTFDIPVIDIPISVYDMIRSIKMAENYKKKFAIAAYPSITNCAKTLCDLLQLQIKIVTFEQFEDISSQLAELKKHNYELIVSDVIGTTTASKLGMNSILISSWTESIELAIENAYSFIRSLSHNHHQKNLFQSLVLKEDRDILIYDENSQLYFSSLFFLDDNSLIHNFISTYLSNLIQCPEQKIEKIIENMTYTLENHHIFLEQKKYTVISISKQPLLFSAQDEIISIYNSQDDSSSELNYNSANYVGELRNTIQSYSQTKLPILILGEMGTGKDKSAFLIHQNSALSKRPLYTIDCSLIGERRFHTLLTSSNSILNFRDNTIHFKSIETLTKKQMEKLFSYIHQTNLTKYNHIIFSFTETPQYPSNTSPICLYLMNKLQCLVLRLPPIRERTSDIPSILTLYLNQLNVELGTQIIGFEQEALQLMIEYPWPQNLNQLRRVLKELAVLTHHSYIKTETVIKHLKEENYTTPPTWKPSEQLLLNLNQSLDEINYDIIRIVLQEENNSKEKTAKRLGISRSTLWRFLKSHDIN